MPILLHFIRSFRYARKCVGLPSLVFAFSSTFLTSPVGAQEPPVLDVRSGATVEREIRNGEVHDYRLELAANTYLLLEIEEVEGDLEAELTDPREMPIASADGPQGVRGSKTLAVVTSGSVDSRLRVRPRVLGAIAGYYRLRVRDLRPAGEKDALRVRAVRALGEAQRLNSLAGTGSRDAALAKAREALSLWQQAGDEGGEAEALTEIGRIHSDSGNCEEAFGWFRRSLDKAVKSGYREAEAWALGNIGFCEDRMAEFPKAIASYGRTLAIWRELGRVAEQGFTLLNLGTAQFRNRELNSALRSYQDALALQVTARDSAGQAHSLSGIGAIHFQRGELSEALAIFEQALEISRSVRDVDALIQIEANIAAIHLQRGQLQRAVDILSRLLGTGDVQPREECSLFQYLGTSYLDLGEPEKALDSYQRSLLACREDNDVGRQINVQIYIGWTRQVLGDREGALAEYTKAQALSPEGLWTVAQFMGLGHLALDAPERALPFLERALALARKAGSPNQQTSTLLALGSAHRDLGENDLAAQRFTEAIRLGLEFEYPSAVAPGYLRRATLRRDLGDLFGARSDVEKALAIIESTRRNVAGQQIRTAYFASKQAYYEMFIDLLMRLDRLYPGNGFQEAAFDASENARARGLLDLLAEGRIDVSQGVPADLKREGYALAEEFSRVQKELNSNPGAERSRELRAKLDELSAIQEALDWKIRESNPRYAQVRYPVPLGEMEIRGKALDGCTALLEYSLGEERSFLFVVTREGLTSYILPPREEIAEKVRRLRQALEEDSLLTRRHLHELGFQLYQDLVAPAAPALAGKSDLLIVPDRALYYLPFEVLLTQDAGGRPYQDLPYFLRDYTITYVPSASVLAELQAIQAGPYSAESKDFVAFAPFAGSAGPEGGTRALSGDASPWKPLPASRREVLEVAALYPGKSLELLNGQAREEVVKGDPAVASAKRLHFATHAEPDERRPELSALILARREGGREDALLQMREIFNLKLAADLVVLSACQTALGKEVTGEGLVGLSRAFFYAGVPSLMVSLWNVTDSPIPDLMLDFYRYLDVSGDKARALQRAKLALIQRKSHAHPAYWAPFILVGKPR